MTTAHAKARQVVVAGGIHAGHFRRFTSQQRTARATAALGHAADDLDRLLDIQLAGSKII